MYISQSCCVSGHDATGQQMKDHRPVWQEQTTITASNQPLADTETADSKQTKTTEDDDKVVGQNANGQNADLMA